MLLKAENAPNQNFTTCTTEVNFRLLTKLS